MNRYSADPVMAGLKDFQRSTVAHVMDRFFGTDPTRRFLVADETGLGKSVVARGVIARTLELLQDDAGTERVDVIYVCSNQDIAKQNLERLQVTTGETVTLSSRLTMLATDIDMLTAARVDGGNALNLVAFTPGTSFDQGWRTGKGEERALLFLLLQEASDWDGWRTNAALTALKAGINERERFRDLTTRVRGRLGNGIDETIRAEFLRLTTEQKLLARFDTLLDDIGRKPAVPVEQQEPSRQLTAELRTALAEAGIQALHPNLIILDEFQRFRQLLDPQEGGEGAELAQRLFDYPHARVLLLSATPYKPFTFAEEAAGGEDHHADFQRILHFLCHDRCWQADVAKAFESYRDRLVRGQPCGDDRDTLRALLLRVMCRTERPRLAQDEMLRTYDAPADAIGTRDISGYIAMRRVAAAVNAPMSIEYWKSAPYFLNFVDGYLLGAKVREALRDERAEQVRPLLRSAQLLSPRAVNRHAQIDLGNGRLRQLVANTVDHGWWRLLWVPPSMPHYALGEPFAQPARDGMTKQLLFSSWNATPNAVAGLLSYEAERRIVRKRLSDTEAVERRRRRARLDYRIDGGHPAGMSTLALFWPHPTLAALGDPLDVARCHPDQLPPLPEVEQALRSRLLRWVPDDLRTPEYSGEPQPWTAVFRWPGADLDGQLTEAMIDEAMGAASTDEDETRSGLRRHITHALGLTRSDRPPVANDPQQVADDLVAIAAHGPGNIAWRALARLIRPDSTVTPAGHWRAAATIASGLRTLFNRVESMLLLDQFVLDQFAPGVVYWRAVLRYCAAGGLQAVLDEYLHMLRSADSDLPLDDEAMLRLAQKARQALATRTATLSAFNPLEPDTPIKLPARFALRYGGRGAEGHGDDLAGVSRQSEVRNAFNSPFWPFVVATTSTGQEGIDFHLWCSAVVHWNTPPNPVDLEQREGRVHRFGGHAIRRNIAAAHRCDALRQDEPDLWASAYQAARAAYRDLGDFSPYWVYPGPAKIERHVLPYPLSKDQNRLTRLTEDLVLYRLAFGQPRQEDMLALVRRNGVTADCLPDVLDLSPTRHDGTNAQRGAARPAHSTRHR